MSAIWEEILPIWINDLDQRLAICWRELEVLSTELERIERVINRDQINPEEKVKLNRLDVLIDLVHAEVNRLVLCKLDAQHLTENTNLGYDI